MDIISHGLWGGIAFGRKQKRIYLWSFVFGILPDLLSFGLYSVATILGIVARPNWGSGNHSAIIIPQFVHTLYNVTHSLIIFAIIFGLVWLILKKPWLPLLAWGLHILMDIPTHSADFFPTPFLWPISNFHINGIAWSRPIIFWPDWILLIIVYLAWWLYWKRKRKLTIARLKQ